MGASQLGRQCHAIPDMMSCEIVTCHAVTLVFLDCEWYGTVFCDGDVVEDLFRWWFKMKCSKGKFSVDSSNLAEVIRRKALEAAKKKEQEM